MEGREPPSPSEQLLAATLILLVLGLAYGGGYLVALLLGSVARGSATLEVPTWARLAGLVLLAAGGWVVASVFRVRHLDDVWISTSITFLKLIGRRPLSETAGRTEPFVPEGPYTYVRSPMYFGIVLGVWGLGVLLSSLSVLLWGAILAGWYGFVLIPFEERELGALFGESHARYRRQVPMLFPNGRRYRPEA